jgi:hypothetical protein
MNTHTTLGGLAMACITLGTFILFHTLAEYLEHREARKWWKENSPTNFDLDK